MEQSFVAWAKMRARKLPQVKLGIGDDAAILAASSDDLVVTSDTLMDGVHFLLAQVDARRVGRKTVNVNLSDLAAMGATPEAVFLSMCLPVGEAFEPLRGKHGSTDALAAELYEGICEACEKYGVALAGGDTNCWEGPLVLSITAVGRVGASGAWLRSGAQPDDAIVVTGKLGGSLAGKHLDFEPRLDLVERLKGCSAIHAAMDISDGLSVDLLRMCDASRCGAIVELEAVPISEAAQAMSLSSDKTALEHALGDGEDFELLLAVDAAQLDAFAAAMGNNEFYQCGEFTSRTGLWTRSGGRIEQLTSSGYVHGR